MVGVPCFSTMWRCGPSLRIGWPLPCFSFSQRISAGPMTEGDEERRHHRPAGAEGEVSEQTEAARTGRHGSEVKDNKTSAPLRLARFQRFDDDRHRLPIEPLTRTVSPGFSAATSGGRKFGRVAA